VAFVLLGDGPETSALEKAIAARRLTNVHLKPARDDIAVVLADADIVMFPSEREGLPIAGIESMSMGKPIVASKVPGWVELVADGVDGFLIESGDIPGYATAVTRLLGDRALYDRMSRAARDKATSQYDLAGSTHTWERLLATLSADAKEKDA
jgi:glycosyltransferase involved in cell wall biosynthesis